MRRISWRRVGSDSSAYCVTSRRSPSCKRSGSCSLFGPYGEAGPGAGEFCPGTFVAGASIGTTAASGPLTAPELPDVAGAALAFGICICVDIRSSPLRKSGTRRHSSDPRSQTSTKGWSMRKMEKENYSITTVDWPRAMAEARRAPRSFGGMPNVQLMKRTLWRLISPPS